jgi:phage shock protein PspC (stress-responsive transcriptional regulator)
MTETPEQAQQRGGNDRHAEGVDTAHLRDYRQLHRSRTDRKVAGVAGGLGRHLNIDPTIIRVALVVLCLFGGAGFVLYGVAWLLVPEDGRSEGAISTHSGTRNTLLIIAGVVAAFLVVANSWDGFGFKWPLAVLALIAFVILMNRDKSMDRQPEPPHTPGYPPPGGTTMTTAVPGTPGTGTVSETDTDTTADPGAEPGTEPTMTYPTDYGSQPPAPPWMPPTQKPYEPPRPRRDRGPLLFGITLALVAVALGSLGLYDVAGGHVATAAYPALALAVIGAMLVVGAWVGRAGGLIFLGLVSVVTLAATAVANPGFSGDRDIRAVPVNASAVRSSYYVPAGRVFLNLNRVHDVSALTHRTIQLKANAGELVVVVPSDVSAHVTADVTGAGEAQTPTENRNGFNVKLTDNMPAIGKPKAHVNLDLDLVVGHIEVRQS